MRSLVSAANIINFNSLVSDCMLEVVLCICSTVEASLVGVVFQPHYTQNGGYKSETTY
jgi:hypothetical protein